MVISNNQDKISGDKKKPVNSKGGGGSWGTNGSGQSVSTSGSVGSPLTRSDSAGGGGGGGGVVTPVTENKILRLNNLDSVGSQEVVGDKKKKQRQRATGPDKGNRGLRQFSMKVCEKVESKGRTTYNEVADELVAEYTDTSNAGETPDQPYDEKNIRRRVYDALNVIMAMDIISKDKKEIQWKGFPRTSLDDIQEIKRERLAIRSRMEKKAAYLKELQDQYEGLQNLVHRNERLYSSGNAPNGGVSLPFILVQTQPHATVEVEISEDMQLVHFDFNSTPFELHDDNYVLKAMKLSGQPEFDDMTIDVSDQPKEEVIANDTASMFWTPSKPTVQSGKPSSSPPVPGILKPRAKHGH